MYRSFLKVLVPSYMALCAAFYAVFGAAGASLATVAGLAAVPVMLPIAMLALVRTLMEAVLAYRFLRDAYDDASDAGVVVGTPHAA